MEFEWDEEKRLANVAKHGIDFERVRDMFDGRPIFTKVSPRFDEDRFTTTGMSGGRFLTVVWTQRGDRRRLISARGARDAEKRAYGELHEGRVGGDDRPW